LFTDPILSNRRPIVARVRFRRGCVRWVFAYQLVYTSQCIP
jgi:hypothetical protein